MALRRGLIENSVITSDCEWT